MSTTAPADLHGIVPATTSGTTSEAGSATAGGSGVDRGTPRGTDAETHDARLARARAVLGDAERRAARVGGRIDRTALRAVGGLGGPTGLVPVPAHPRHPQASPPMPDTGSEGPEAAPEDGYTRLDVPAPLAPLIPYGALRAGSSLAVTGEASTSLLLSLAVSAAGEDDWCAIAGMPDLGLRAALDAGLDPCRLVIVPDAAEQAAQVLSALVDGVGVLVLGSRPALAPALWRTLLSRARTRDTLVLAADPPGRADLQLEAVSRGWEGLGTGSGRLRRRRVEVAATGRGIAGQRTARVLLPEVRGMIAAGSAAAVAAPVSVPVPLRSIRRAG